MREFNWTVYILSALRKSGVRDVEQHAHDIVVYLLVRPGKLFSVYGDKSGPMEQRFKVSVRNAIKNLRKKSERRERVVGASSGEVASPKHEESVEEFRRFVRKRSVFADQVLGKRLEGWSVRRLFSQFGEYRVREAIKLVKRLAVEYGAASTVGAKGDRNS